MRASELGGLGMLEALIGAEQVAQAEDGYKPAIRPELLRRANHYTVQFLTQFVDPAAAGPSSTSARPSPR